MDVSSKFKITCDNHLPSSLRQIAARAPHSRRMKSHYQQGNVRLIAVENEVIRIGQAQREFQLSLIDVCRRVTELQLGLSWEASIAPSGISDISNLPTALKREVNRIASNIANPTLRAGFIIDDRPYFHVFSEPYFKPSKRTNANRTRDSSMCIKFSSSTACKMLGLLVVRSKISTRFFDLDEHTRAAQTTTTNSFLYRPAPWLIRCGLKYGIEFVAIQALKGWKYVFKPIHAVRDDSLIFTFCAAGNLEAVRVLFSRGEASVWDTDFRGWTPLHVSYVKFT
ncbi:hypothetical protein M432DRAFT_142731 [Thermoascus aurantiacus ATCC 26904]